VVRTAPAFENGLTTRSAIVRHVRQVRGIRRIMFAVDDIDDVVARLHAHGAELVGEVVQYEDTVRLCYVRGPEGIIVGLAEQLG